MKHTPGPWYPSFHAGICIGVQNSPDGFTQMICNSILPENDEAYAIEVEQIESDMKLIAAAPNMLSILEKTYLNLQTMVQKELMNGSALLAAQTDSIRASLRNDISEITGEGCRELQERIEEAAFNKAKGPMNTLIKSNIEETIINWFGSYGLEIKDIKVERDPQSDEPRLYKATGEIYPCLFDKDMDGKKLEVRFQLEVAMQDERFGGCDLIFTSDTTFKII